MTTTELAASLTREHEELRGVLAGLDQRRNEVVKRLLKIEGALEAIQALGGDDAEQGKE